MLRCSSLAILFWSTEIALAQQVFQPPVATFPPPTNLPTAPAVAPPVAAAPVVLPSSNPPLLRSPVHVGPTGPSPGVIPRPATFARDHAAATLQQYRETGNIHRLTEYVNSQLPAAEAVPVILRLLEEVDAEGKKVVLRGLQQNYPHDSCAGVPRMIELTRSPDVQVSAAAAETLGSLRPVREETIFALMAILQSPDETRDVTESQTVDVIRKEGDREVRAQEVQTRLWRQLDPRIEVRRAAAKAMAAIGRDSGVYSAILQTMPPSLDAELGYHLFRFWCTVVPATDGLPRTPEEEHDYAYRRLQEGRASPSQIMGFLARLYPRLPPGRQAVVLEWLRYAHQVPAELTQIVIEETRSRDAFTAGRARQAIDGMTPARGPDNVRVIAHYLKHFFQSRNPYEASLAEAAARVAVNYGEPVPEFEEAARYVLGLAAVGGPGAPHSTTVEQALDILYSNPSKDRLSAEAAEKLMSADAGLYRDRLPGDFVIINCRRQAAVTAAANGPLGSPEALKCVEEFLTPPADNQPYFAELAAAARYVGAMPPGSTKERLAAQLARALDDDFHAGIFYVPRFGQHRFGAGDPLFGEHYSNARIEAMQALATMDAPFLQPLEEKLRRRAQDAPLPYGSAQSHLLAAQMLQKIAAAR